MPCMITGASDGMAPAWLATSSAPPVRGILSMPVPLGAEPVAVDRAVELPGDAAHALRAAPAVDVGEPWVGERPPSLSVERPLPERPPTLGRGREAGGEGDDGADGRGLRRSSGARQGAAALLPGSCAPVAVRRRGQASSSPAAARAAAAEQVGAAGHQRHGRPARSVGGRPSSRPTSLATASIVRRVAETSTDLVDVLGHPRAAVQRERRQPVRRDPDADGLEQCVEAEVLGEHRLRTPGLEVDDEHPGGRAIGLAEREIDLAAQHDAPAAQVRRSATTRAAVATPAAGRGTCPRT